MTGSSIVTERALTTTVDNIEHIESQSLYGIAVVKVFLQPTANTATRYRADHGNFADATQAIACRNDAAADSRLQRIECAGAAAGSFRTGTL